MIVANITRPTNPERTQTLELSALLTSPHPCAPHTLRLPCVLEISQASRRPLMTNPAPDFTLLTADRLIDGTGSPPLERAAILLEGDRIAAVGTEESVIPPEGANPSRKLSTRARPSSPGWSTAMSISTASATAAPVTIWQPSRTRFSPSSPPTTPAPISTPA